MAAINYDAIPETARQDLLAVIYKMTVELFKDPATQADYEEWLAKREAAKESIKRGPDAPHWRT